MLGWLSFYVKVQGMHSFFSYRTTMEMTSSCLKKQSFIQVHVEVSNLCYQLHSMQLGFSLSKFIFKKH